MRKTSQTPDPKWVPAKLVRNADPDRFAWSCTIAATFVFLDAMQNMAKKHWFSNCRGLGGSHSLEELLAGIRAGLLNAQDEYGCSALMLAVSAKWNEGVEYLLGAGADTELRYFRTGTTALYDAALRKNTSMAILLVAAGANPDAPNPEPLGYYPATMASVGVRASARPYVTASRAPNPERRASRGPSFPAL